MRILLLSNLYPPHVLGGAEIVAKDYAVKLTELGHEVIVLTSSYGLPGPRREGQIWYTLHYTPAAHFDHKQPIWQQLNLLSNYYHSFHNSANAKELQHVIAEVKPDVLYIWEITGIGLNTMLQAFHQVKIPIVFHLGSYWLHYVLKPETEQTRLRTRWLKQLLIGSVPTLVFTTLIAVSQSVKDEYVAAGCDPERIEVIYNGINKRFLNTPRTEQQDKNSSELKEVRLMYVGRLCIEKGVLVILKALDILVNEQKRQHLLLDIFGDGDEAYVKELHSFIEEKQLTQLVSFHGKVSQDELIKQYDRSDILLIPSIWKEPFGLVVAEGMARGLPIITSSIGGPAEIVTNNVNGLLIEPGDEQALAASIMQLIEDSVRCHQFAQAARTTVQQRFMIEENAKRVEKHLMQVVQNKLNGIEYSMPLYTTNS